MSIVISSIRLSNFRAFHKSELNLATLSSVLIGANNVGKTSFFHALRLMFDPNYKPNAEDVFRKPGDSSGLLTTKKIFVDVLLRPNNESGEQFFSDLWQDHFGEHVTIDEFTEEEYVPFRAIVTYDPLNGDYRVDRKCLRVWPSFDSFLEYEEYKTVKVTNRLLDSLPVFYMDARRDIVFDMRDRFSYFAKLVKDIKVNEEQIEAFETSLAEINRGIVNESEVLSHLTEKLSMVSNTMNKTNSQISINPIAQRIKEIGKNLEITFKDENSEEFPISSHGMGTRSWITFLTVLSYVDWQLKLKRDAGVPYHPIILLEEPEAHLHPNSQRNIYKQIQALNGQIFVSTHSPIVVAQSELKDMVYVSKKFDSSFLKSMDFEITHEEYTKVKHEILKSRGELLFSEGIILCEGQTEEQVLPDFFEEKFKLQPYECGFNVVSVGGSGKKYLPFLMVAKWFGIPTYIFSDGESKTKKDLKIVLGEVFDNPTEYSSQLNRVLFLSDGNDFESYLIENGYANDLIQAIEFSLEDEGAFDTYISKNNKQSGRPSPTSKTCGACKQKIYDRTPKDYDGDEGRLVALKDFSKKHKALYSSVISKVIISNHKGTDLVIPEAIDVFLEKIKTDLL